jgi:hypothetical protein
MRACVLRSDVNPGVVICWSRQDEFKHQRLEGVSARRLLGSIQVIMGWWSFVALLCRAYQ